MPSLRCVAKVAVKEDGLHYDEREWLVCPTEGVRAVSFLAASMERRHHILRCLKRHKVDIAGLQEEHFKDEATVRNQRWWSQRQGYDMLAATQAGMARRSSAVLRKMDEWALVASKVLSTRLILGHFRHSGGGEVVVLVGHMECEPGPGKGNGTHYTTNWRLEKDYL